MILGLQRDVQKGQVTDVLEVVLSEQGDADVGAQVGQVSCDGDYDDTELQERKRLLAESFGHIDLPLEQKGLIHHILGDHHDVFALSDREWGQTDLIEMEIETGNAQPIR